jgi:hypothetical protein
VGGGIEEWASMSRCSDDRQIDLQQKVLRSENELKIHAKLNQRLKDRFKAWQCDVRQKVSCSTPSSVPNSKQSLRFVQRVP